MATKQEILDAVKELQREVIACRLEMDSIKEELFKQYSKQAKVVSLNSRIYQNNYWEKIFKGEFNRFTLEYIKEHINLWVYKGEISRNDLTVNYYEKVSKSNRISQKRFKKALEYYCNYNGIKYE